MKNRNCLLIAGLLAALSGASAHAESVLPSTWEEAAAVPGELQDDASQTRAKKSRKQQGSRTRTATDKRQGTGSDKSRGANTDRIKGARKSKKAAQGEDGSDKAKGLRAQNARQKKAKQDQVNQRVKNARQLKNAKEVDREYAERVKAARSQQAANEAKDQRISKARKQYTEAQRAERIANARRDLAGLDEGQVRTVKRFLLEQEKHHMRLARIDRIGNLLRAKGDSENMARVDLLRRKELQSFANFKAAMRKALTRRQASAIESAGEVGTHKRVRLQGSDGKAVRARNVKGTPQKRSDQR